MFSYEKNAPPVRPVQQKGLGLASLKQSLSLFSEEANRSEIMNEQQARILRQKRLEADAIKSAIDRWHHELKEMKDSGIDPTGSGRKLSWVIGDWHCRLVSKIQEELVKVTEAEDAKKIESHIQLERRECGVFLRCMDPERLAAVVILNVVGIFSRAGIEKGLKLSSLATTVGKEVQDEIIAEEVLRKNKEAETWRLKIVNKMIETRKRRTGRGKWRFQVREIQDADASFRWPARVTARVGAFLIGLLMEVAKVPVAIEIPETMKRTVSMQPAFQHSYFVSQGRRIGVIHIHREISKRLYSEPPDYLLTRHLPMLAEPEPWTAFNDGGFLAHKCQLMRVSPGDIQQERYLKAALNDGGLEHIRAGLDVLGKTAWVINKDVFDIMLEAWNSGEAIANFPAEDPNLPIPPKPSDKDTAAQRKWVRAVREIENKRSGLHSTRCFQNFQMEVARCYIDETFYLPHNMDFRGRAYPLPPYLNQMGADNCRGLLLFKEAKPLGSTGLKWLKIHLANVYGFDKANLEDREKFATEHLNDILDSANNGLHGRRWFLQAEDPWQCLAACCELRNALRLPDPTEYTSQLPIHQDGSCNGLQHYAALGGDVDGAKQVNLEPSGRPSDVYTGVAEFVKEAIAREAEGGCQLAKILDGKIKRKIVKQTVMTNVYGVTFLGAVRQVHKQLVDHYPDLPEMMKCSGYIARKIFNALGSMFGGAHSIQYWFGDCASRITMSLSPEQIEDFMQQILTPDSERDSSRRKATKKHDPASKFRASVTWTTPLGLPVIQPYRTSKTQRVRTTLQELCIANSSAEDVVVKRKQLQAFPPNFIHSLDATHMILSANECHRRNLTFSAVHDSFWTHACDIDVMNNVLRDAFVCMHSDDIIQRLAAEFRVRYGNNLFLARVKRTSPIGRAIEKYRGPRGKRNVKLMELFAEHKRQTLLKSEDAELQEQGRAIVTPASIFEQMNGTDHDLAVSTSLGETAIGRVPSDTTEVERSYNATGVDVKDPAISSLFSEFDPQIADGSVTDSSEINEPGEDKTGGSTKKKREFLSWLWLPMTFRDVPRRGEFDLYRIKESKYFFS